jgi:N-acetylglutamate synthase-like GNAT family acetyltransferase
MKTSKKELKLDSQFKSSKEFYAHLEMWLLEYRGHFSKGELIGFKQLACFATEIPGVCNTHIGSILEAIHDEYYNNGISRTTFKRMVLKAKKVGLLTVYETTRENGSQSSNLYVFNRFP